MSIYYVTHMSITLYTRRYTCIFNDVTYIFINYVTCVLVKQTDEYVYVGVHVSLVMSRIYLSIM